MSNILEFPRDDHALPRFNWREWARIEVASFRARRRALDSQVAHVEWKPDVSGNPREMVNMGLMDQVRQARNLLVDESKKVRLIDFQ